MVEEQTLNEAQKEAVSLTEGPLLVLAGPGSGKTFVLVKRLLYLVEEQKAAPERILVVTFTRAAAQEMEQRYLALRAGKAEEWEGKPVFGTFHSVFFQILRYSYGYGTENILTEQHRNEILFDIVRKLAGQEEDKAELIRELSAQISYVKGCGLSALDYKAENIPTEIFSPAYEAYQERLKEENLLDFDDMLLLTKELFEKRPDILSAWQKRFSHIEVDEVQDANALQMEIIRMMAAPKNNLMMVGDDDQSLYGFRGASPEVMLSFKEMFPEGRIVALTENYRSDPGILSCAGRLIAHNASRYKKEIHPRCKAEEGEVIAFRQTPDGRSECETLVSDVRQMAEEVPLDRMAVLFRTNRQMRPVAQTLLSRGVPFVVRDYLPPLSEHWITRDMLAYLHFAAGDRKKEHLLRIINRPKRYVTREALLTLPEPVPVEKLFSLAKDKYYVREKLEKFTADLEALRQYSPYAAIHYLRHVAGYGDFLNEYAKWRNADADELFDVLDEVEDSARDCVSIAEWEEKLLSSERALKSQTRRTGEPKKALSLLTYHGAKGLEFDAVFLPDVICGVTPYKKAKTKMAREEERRMFYVALTRARKRVRLYQPLNRMGHVTELSPFVKEMLPKASDLKEGDVIHHRQYGKGLILTREKTKPRARVRFSSGEKILDLGFCIRQGFIIP